MEELELEIQRSWISRLQPGSHAALSLAMGTLRMWRRKQIPSANTSFYTCYVGCGLRKEAIAAAYGCSSWGSSSAWGCSWGCFIIWGCSSWGFFIIWGCSSAWGCIITWGCSIIWGCSSAWGYSIAWGCPSACRFSSA